MAGLPQPRKIIKYVNFYDSMSFETWQITNPLITIHSIIPHNTGSTSNGTGSLESNGGMVNINESYFEAVFVTYTEG